MPLLDAKLTKKDDGSVKSTIYRNTTYTAQYINFTFHHQRNQKLGVVRTLTTSVEEDKKEEDEYLKGSVRWRGYPAWGLKHMMGNKKRKRTEKRKKDNNNRK